MRVVLLSLFSTSSSESFSSSFSSSFLFLFLFRGGGDSGSIIVILFLSSSSSLGKSFSFFPNAFSRKASLSFVINVKLFNKSSLTLVKRSIASLIFSFSIIFSSCSRLNLSCNCVNCSFVSRCIRAIMKGTLPTSLLFLPSPSSSPSFVLPRKLIIRRSEEDLELSALFLSFLLFRRRR